MKNLSTEPTHHKSNSFGPYELLQTLGEGEFGKVKLGAHVETGREVAVKLIKKERGASNRISKIEREISILKTLDHPYIVKLYNVIETEKQIGIILEYAPGGELFEYILAHRCLKEKDAKRFFAQLISSVYYMHNRKIVHRDLKLENILLDKDCNIVVTDFGFANQFASAADDMMATTCGSPCYAAPELVVNPGLYAGSAVDVWSCGVILYAMLCGFLPFDDDPSNPDSDDINQLYRYILSTELMFPSYISSEPRNLLKKILVADPAKRCSLEYIIKHSWLKEYHKFIVKDSQPNEAKRTSISGMCVSQLEKRYHASQRSSHSIFAASQSFFTSSKRDSRVLEMKESHLPTIDLCHDAHALNEKYASPSEEQTQKIGVIDCSLNDQLSNTSTVAPNSQNKSRPEKIQPSGQKSVKNDSAIAVMFHESLDKDTQPIAEKSLSSPLLNRSENQKITFIHSLENKSRRRGPEKFMGLLAQSKEIYEVPDLDVALEENEEDENSLLDDENKRSEISCALTNTTQLQVMNPRPKIEKCHNVRLVEQDAEQYDLFDHDEERDTFVEYNLRPKATCPLKLEKEEQNNITQINGTLSFKEAKGLEQRCLFFKNHPINSKILASSSPAQAASSSPSAKIKNIEPSISMRVSMSESGKKAIEAVRRSIYRKHKSQPPACENKRTSHLKNRLEDESIHRSHRNTWAAPPRTHKFTVPEEPLIVKSTGKKMMDWIRKKSHAKEYKRQSIAVVSSLSTQPSSKTHKTQTDNHYRPVRNNAQRQSCVSNKHDSISKEEHCQADVALSPPSITHTRDDKTKEQSEETIEVPNKSRLMYNHQAQSMSETALVQLREQEMKPLKKDDLKFHQGVIDRSALTSQAPIVVIQKLRQILSVLGIEMREENKFALRCTRRKANSTHNQNRRSEMDDDLDLSSMSSDIVPVIQGLEPIYGSAGVDNGEEVRFSVEICQIRNLPELYVVDIRRIKGNAWTYKFLYHKLTGLLNLEQEGYMAS